MNNKTIKLVFHYIGEILIVIIGILIAFQLNNWKESVNMENEGIKSLERILEDLTEKKSF